MTENAFPISDAPTPDPRVRQLLSAAAAPVETAGPLPGEDEALAAFRAARQSTRRTSKLPRLGSAKTALAAAIGTGVLLAGGVGAAVAGVLPGASQETVSGWLDTVGISVPAGERADENGDPRDRFEQPPGEAAEENADLHDRSEQAPGEAAGKNGDPRDRSEQTPAEAAEPPPAADHGKRVSETAKDTTSEGKDKGKEIAEAASDGRGKSGDRGPAQTPGGQKRAGEQDRKPPPVSAPNPNRTGTAPDTTDSQSSPPGPPATGQ